jgi:hypothetical protein
MDEPRQLDGDPSRKASWNRLLGNGKVDRLRNPGTPLGRSHFGRESLNGLERSKSAIGRPQEKYPGFLFKLLPRYLSRFMRQKGWGSARAPFYRATPLRLNRHREDRMNRFDMSISAEEWKEWDHIFASSIPPNPAQILNTETIDTLIDAIYKVFNTACTATMKKKGAAPGFSSKWWNDECREAATALANAPEEERTRLGRELKRAVCIAKRDWANSYISEANIWEVAAWRHGRRSSHIPALIDHTGELTYDHEQMASLLSEQFFAKDEGNIPTHFTDDPPPRTPRQFAPFGKEELLDLLKQTSNKSAPGILGIGWDLLKRGWPHCDNLLTNIYSACIRLGHHPSKWKEATVVIIPKPNKPDYSLAKAHRPISLLETLSKLMEKAVAVMF